MVSQPRLLLHQALPDRDAIFAAAWTSCIPCFETDPRHNGVISGKSTLTIPLAHARSQCCYLNPLKMGLVLRAECPEDTNT